MKKLLTMVALSLSVTAQASTIDDLVTTSGSIVQTFDSGIKAVAGMRSYSDVGGIAPDGTIDQGIITQAQADAYNNAVSNLDYAINAQEYYQTQADEQRQVLDQAISAFVGAATAVIEVVVVNNMATEAQASGDLQAAADIQIYAETNDVTLETAEITAYNDSLADVEAAAQATAAFTAIASNPALSEAADQAASDAGTSYSAAASAYFDSGVGVVSVGFTNIAVDVSVDVTAYFKSVEEIYMQGETDSFYLTSPTGDACFFAGPEDNCAG